MAFTLNTGSQQLIPASHSFLRTARSLVGLTLVLLFLASSAALAQEGQDRPNIVLIMADDMGYETVTANGGESYRTPNLDRLAETGMRFTQAHAQPICTPSRVEIMTGIHNSRNYDRFGYLNPEEYTFGNLLKDNGYATAIVGKWQLEGGFDRPHHFGFDEYALWQLTRRPNRYANPGLEINGEERDYNNGEYGPDLLNDYALDFIERKSNKEKPFFLYYPMVLPHWPFEPTPDSEEWDPTFRRGDDAEKSKKGWRTKDWDNKFFPDMIAYTDKLVGKVVSKLEKVGERDNTLVIFTGDNGTYTEVVSTFNGRTWKGGKGHMMDNGTHVPLIANMPGTVPEGKVNHDLIDFTDFFATLADVASADIPDHLNLNSRSFAPQLTGKSGNARQRLYCWYFRDGQPNNGKSTRTTHTGGEFARTQTYKLYKKGYFYNVKTDFYEKNPIPDKELTEEQKTIRKQLRTMIQKQTREGFRE